MKLGKGVTCNMLNSCHFCQKENKNEFDVYGHLGGIYLNTIQ